MCWQPVTLCALVSINPSGETKNAVPLLSNGASSTAVRTEFGTCREARPKAGLHTNNMSVAARNKKCPGAVEESCIAVNRLPTSIAHWRRGTHVPCRYMSCRPVRKSPYSRGKSARWQLWCIR